MHSHYGGLSNSNKILPVPAIPDGGWLQGNPTSFGRAQREFPDMGRGDFGQPAIRVRHGDGTTVTAFTYDRYEIIEGKQGLPGLPACYGDPTSATTLLVHLQDKVAELSATLSYCVFPEHDAIVRSFSIDNHSSREVVIESAMSFSVDLGNSAEGREMIQLSGDWARETQTIRRKVDSGFQG